MALVNSKQLVGSSVCYERHQPEKTLLYKLVQENLNSFYQQVDQEYDSGLPDFVKKEFDEFLKCGILAHGFLRAKCEDCSHEKLVAFSCKKRGFCPSCGARRMVESAAHLVDEVFPHKPLRQWVISFPYQLRYLFAKEPKVMSEVLAVVNRAISTHLLKKAGFTKKSKAKTGAVTFVQRFGGSMNLNIHFHIMYLDGVYTFTQDKGEFHKTKPPTQKELENLLTTITNRVISLLVKRGLIIKDEDEGYLLPTTGEAFEQIQSSSITYRIAFGKRKGQKALSLQTIAERAKGKDSEFLARHSGFSLHAGVSCQGHEREKLERICRYIARPSLSEERLSQNARGQVIYKLKKAYDNGTTHIVLEPLDLLSRLASLVPRPRVNLTRFHGVFAPHFKHRSLVVPKPKKKIRELEEESTPKQKTAGMTWAQRLKRVFNIDIEICPECRGKLKIIACIEDPKAIGKILSHLGLAAEAPLPWPPRGPPINEQAKQNYDEDYNQYAPNYDL